MVVRCSSCRGVVLAPDPHRTDLLIGSVYAMFDKKCKCGNVHYDEDTNLIAADSDAELWHPPEQQWVRYVPYTT